MADQLVLAEGKLALITEEGNRLERPESELVEMLRRDLVPPLGGEALPDGVKFVRWQNPWLVVVHQLPPRVRLLRWISSDSPQDYGPGTTYRQVRISLPYSITFAVYCMQRDHLFLSGSNELYFRNAPLRELSDSLCYPALLNISKVNRGNRFGAWICTQHLHLEPNSSWTKQLASLLNHTWDGGFNRSSERHEGASWYAESKSADGRLHPVENWVPATNQNEAMALSVPWKAAPLNVGQMIDALLTEAAAAQSQVQHQKLPHSQPGLLSQLINFIQGRKHG